MLQILCIDYYDYDDYVVLSSNDKTILKSFLKENGCEISKEIEVGDTFYPTSDRFEACIFKIEQEEEQCG